MLILVVFYCILALLVFAGVYIILTEAKRNRLLKRIEHTLDAMKEEHTEAQRWRDASVTPPSAEDADINGNVLALYRDGRCDLCAWDDLYDMWDVTHWMPLPAAPEKGASHAD